MVQRNEKRATHTSRCPVCDQQDDQFHYITCSHELFDEARDFAWRRFCQTMKTYRSQTTMLRIIWIGMQNWTYNYFDGKFPQGDEINSHDYELLCDAYDDQGKIGWDNFMRGRISKK